MTECHISTVQYYTLSNKIMSESENSRFLTSQMGGGVPIPFGLGLCHFQPFYAKMPNKEVIRELN